MNIKRTNYFYALLFAFCAAVVFFAFKPMTQVRAAESGNLLVNGYGETGDLTGWTDAAEEETGEGTFSVVDVYEWGGYTLEPCEGDYFFLFSIKSLQTSKKLLIFAAKIISYDYKSSINTDKADCHLNYPKGGKAILYGSRARGDARKDSDWDILILLDKDTLDQSDYDNVSYPFVLLGCDLGQEINPIMYTTKEWESYRITPFYENVTRDGIVLV